MSEEQSRYEFLLLIPFQESDDYLRVFEFLESMERFFYVNVQQARERCPRAVASTQLKMRLSTQIKAM